VYAGPPERIPSRNTLPRWLEALVLKGLSTRPEARFGSMGDLLAQLKGPAPSKRSARAISALALVVVGMLAWREVVRRREDPCAQIEARVAAAWDEPTRARVTAAVTHEPLPWAKDGAALVDDVFRRFLAQWARDSAATCRERDSGANVVARQACLEERFTGFVTFRDALLVPNDAALRHGISVLGQALGTSTCAIRPTYFEVPADTARRSDFVRLRDAYFTLRTRAVLEMVTVDELVTVKQLQQEASTLGFAQLAAAFRQTEGLVLVTRGDPRAAVTAFDDAAVLAEGAHLDVMVADTRRRLVRLWAEELDVKHARTLVLAMRAGYQRLGEDPEANFGALAAEASVLLEESRFDEAIAKMEKAISLIDPADSHSVTDEYRVLTLMQTRANHLDAALANARKASEHAREELGPQHPFYAANLNTEAGVLARLGRDEEALEMVKKALDILARDPDTREYTYLLFNHGLTLKRLNRAKEGLPLLGQAVALAEKRGEGYRLAQMQTGFAEALQEVGELPRALELSDSAVRTTEKAFDEKALQLAAPLSVKGGVLEALGRHVEAAATLRRCLEILAHPDADPVLREVTRYDLGRTLWSDPATRAAGVKLVRDVRAFFAARGSAFGPYVLEADEWLKSHGDTRSRPR
jgi:tetratricopeptide (TPR) repeat protein